MKPLAETIVCLLIAVLSGTAGADIAPSASPVADAAEREDWKQVDWFLQSDTTLSTQVDGMTALHWAAMHGKADVATTLLKHGASPDAATRYQIRPLHIACERGDVAMVSLLLAEGADPNALLPGGQTPLMSAARTGAVDAIKSLIDAGAKVDAQERSQQTALMWAADAGAIEAVDALLKAGAEAEIASRSGFTALLFAARSGRSEVVKRLLQAGVDVNVAMQPKNTGGRQPRRGMSALLLATESGHFELALDLIAAGADPNDQRSGYAPLHALSWVRKAGRGDNPAGDPEPRGSGKIGSLTFARRLIEAGADVRLRLVNGKGGRAKLNPKGATPLLLAARTADLPLVKLLVELGADPLEPNDEGCTPLMAAAGVGVQSVDEEAGTEPEVLETVAYLLALGADPNAKDANNETAMHGAAYRNFPQVVDQLAAAGADPKVWNEKNAAGWTPLRIAEGYRPGSFKPSPPTMAALRRALRSPETHQRVKTTHE